MTSIDVTPTWKAILPILITAIELGTDEGKQTAIQELTRMAEVADLYNATVKNQRRNEPDNGN